MAFASTGDSAYGDAPSVQPNLNSVLTPDRARSGGERTQDAPSSYARMHRTPELENDSVETAAYMVSGNCAFALSRFLVGTLDADPEMA
jgi:hypothetical protein